MHGSQPRRAIASLGAAVCLTLTVAACGAKSQPVSGVHGPPVGASRISSCAAAPFTRHEARRVLRLAETRLTATDGAFRPGRFPSVTDRRGRWQTVSARQWTSGFFPGSLWLAYRATRRPAFETQARAWTRGLAGQARDTSTHDVGFQIMSSFGNGYSLTHSAAYRRVILRAAASLASRYDDSVGAVRSWGPRSDRHHFEVIVDSLMNLGLLFWAGDHGGPHAWKRIATRHALTVAQHFVRRDGSTIHLVDFDPRTGVVLGTANPQGYSADSTWSRGQAWATYGFASAYAETGRLRLLSAARRTADYFIGGLRADCVPSWDFNVPDARTAPADTSAAAIAAEGLLRLSRLDPDPDRKARYASYASRILSSLAGHYLASSGQATLTGGTSAIGVDPPDVGTAYGDYFLLQGIEGWLTQHRR